MYITQGVYQRSLIRGVSAISTNHLFLEYESESSLFTELLFTPLQDE